MSKHCIECVVELATEEDPRDPPLDWDLCLCTSCCIDAHIEAIDDLEEQVSDMKINMKKLEVKDE